MDRSEMEAFIEKFYAARAEGDIEALGESFAANARFQIAGSPEFSMLAALAEGHEAVMGLMRTIADTIAFEDIAILDRVIDGSTAAIRWRATVQLVTSGQSYTTELADFLELEGGKLVSCTEFLDTALAG